MVKKVDEESVKPYKVEIWLNSNYKGLNQVDVKCGIKHTRFFVDDYVYGKLEEAVDYYKGADKVKSKKICGK